jgi:hypothetical protein
MQMPQSFLEWQTDRRILTTNLKKNITLKI